MNGTGANALHSVNGIVQPTVVPPPDKHGRLTNQLLFIEREVVKSLWEHSFSEPFRLPIDAKKLNLPVSSGVYILNSNILFNLVSE